ncbi:vacuolar ATPase assembly integral membrane protein vma21 [Pseudogymnoascus australis]
MATRRTNAAPPTSAGEKAGQGEFAQPLGQPSITAPAVPMHVIVKLLAFTFAMVVVPIGSYFLTLNWVFDGNSTYAGATAAIMANVVLVGYIVVAMNEDQSEAIEAAEKEKKGR